LRYITQTGSRRALVHVVKMLLSRTSPETNGCDSGVALEMLRSTMSSISISELSRGEMITIVSSQEDGQQTTFSIPRELLVSQSEYFAAACSRTFYEGQCGSVKLEGIPNWIMNCFVGWLYVGRIECELSLASDIEAFPNSTLKDRPGIYSFAKPIQVNPRNPVTWHWQALFEIYVFADRFSSRNFRNAVVEVCQIKLWEITPKSYPSPRNEDIAAVANRLPRTSSLYRLLVDDAVFAERYPIFSPNGLMVADCSAVGAEFLAECFLLLKRQQAALKCESCGHTRDEWITLFGGDVMQQKCYPIDHKPEDLEYPFRLYGWCHYHEHINKREKELCRLRWNAVCHRLQP
jgi:hypothetical protein